MPSLPCPGAGPPQRGAGLGGGEDVATAPRAADGLAEGGDADGLGETGTDGLTDRPEGKEADGLPEGSTPGLRSAEPDGRGAGDEGCSEDGPGAVILGGVAGSTGPGAGPGASTR
ncbi:hypothetical protein [Streptomyces sp. CG 926]|uniref:hypothetical protein n=1 Tax=Streptomyces sp. CG 926 TaxID=1882405 RepID=UPI000D6D55DB|nr:hypothetical protein [Streptomyces sp. CG 926]